MKSKKLLLGSLSTMALVATPIAAVVSCDDGKKAEAAAGDKKAAFSAADLIKKIGKDDKGFIATVQIMGQSLQLYVSEVDAKTETTINFNGSKFVLPILTKGSLKMKAKVTYGPKMLQTAKLLLSGTPAEVKAKEAKLHGEQEMVVSATAATSQVGKLVVNKNVIAQNAAGAATRLKGLLTIEDGKGLYPFAFKENTLKSLKPELTVESKTAFDKIFTDLGLQVTTLDFIKDTTESTKIKVAQLTIVEKTTSPVVTPSTQTDLTALKSALGNTVAVTRTAAVSTTSADVDIKVAGKPMTVNEFLAKLKGIIGGTSHIDPITTLVSGKIKDDMVITFSITKAAVLGVAASGTGSTAVAAVPAVNGTAVIKINAAGASEVTVPVTLTP